MSLSQWEVIQSNASLYVGLDIGAPLVGAGSLRIDYLQLQTTIAAATLRLGSSFAQRGFVKGQARTLMQVQSYPLSTAFRHGMVCMMSTANVTAAGTACYVAGVRAQPISWEIMKYTNGLLAAGTSLGSTTTSFPSAGSVSALELTWQYDPVQFDGGIALVLKAGTALDFSNLVTLLSVVDITAPLSTSVGEGLVSLHADVAAGPPVVLFDQTSLTPLV